MINGGAGVDSGWSGGNFKNIKAATLAIPRPPGPELCRPDKGEKAAFSITDITRIHCGPSES